MTADGDADDDCVDDDDDDDDYYRLATELQLSPMYLSLSRKATGVATIEG